MQVFETALVGAVGEDVVDALGKGIVVEACLEFCEFVLSEGLASAEDIDTAMKLGAGHPMGPLQLADLVGIDIALAVCDVLYNEFQDSKYRACPLLRKKVRAGKLGMKTGEGFFKY